MVGREDPLIVDYAVMFEKCFPESSMSTTFLGLVALRSNFTVPKTPYGHMITAQPPKKKGNAQLDASHAI